ncbi:GLPGLI family protein [Bizionia argentinensis JUB59]|uniref:GLPGLI family protein n=1 Tax=Bizionia argentinensis JUB59 TaxID=1046627 RepID=G2EEY2_9FLAO|nr:GLPGLI family protein [Bizionia argentinensis]EGV43032.1 GLPGLI family protein [Bizionia argentinensis JUB59]
MKKYFFGVVILLIHLNSAFSFAQSSQVSGTITYSVSLEPIYNAVAERFKKEANKAGLQMVVNMAQAASNLECKLNFNGFNSKFGLVNTMGLGNADKMMILAVRSVTQGDYYTNLMTQKQILNDNSSKELLIESNLEEPTWQLTKDMKKIGNYTCYKAITYKTLENIGEVPITVWYTPQIPVAFGPKEYVGNLPGLVLEYKDQMVHFVAKKIVLNPNKAITINWPEGKTISKEDYKKQNDFSFSTLKENSGR